MFEYSDLRGRKWREAGKEYKTKCFITYRLHQILGG
jgi:hypothetical protein